MKSIAGLSPRGRARLAGVFEALEGTGSSAGQVVLLGKLVVPASAVATAHNILANEFVFRIGFLLSVGGVVFHLAWVLLMYQLMKVVNRTLAQFAVFVVMICIGLQALTAFLYLAPLVVLQDGVAAAGLSTAQAQSLAFALLKLNTTAFQLDLVFFGLWCVVTGYLILRSTFLPRLLGALLMVDGVGWTLYVWPPLATALFPAIAVVAAFAEFPLQLWLIIFGVNNQRWYARARGGQAADRPSLTVEAAAS